MLSHLGGYKLPKPFRFSCKLKQTNLNELGLLHRNLIAQSQSKGICSSDKVGTPSAFSTSIKLLCLLRIRGRGKRQTPFYIIVYSIIHDAILYFDNNKNDLPTLPYSMDISTAKSHIRLLLSFFDNNKRMLLRDTNNKKEDYINASIFM